MGLSRRDREAGRRVTDLRAEPGYTLWLRFEDGAEGRVCLRHFLGVGMFKAWRNEDIFGDVTIDRAANVIHWNVGVELDMELLYFHVTNKAPLSVH